MEFIDRLSDGEMSLITLRGQEAGLKEWLSSTQNYFYDQMRQALLYNPIVTVMNDIEALEMVSTGKYLLPISSDTAYYIVSKNCQLEILKEKGVSLYRSFVFQKNASILNDFNRGLMAIQDYSNVVIEKYKRKFKSECSTVYGKKKEMKRKIGATPLSLKSLSGVFMAFGMGCVTGCVALVAEIYRNKLNKQEEKEKEIKFEEYNAHYEYSRPRNFSKIYTEPKWKLAVRYSGCATSDSIRHKRKLSD